MTYEGQSEEQCLAETGRATMGQWEQESCGSAGSAADIGPMSETKVGGRGGTPCGLEQPTKAHSNRNMCPEEGHFALPNSKPLSWDMCG